MPSTSPTASPTRPVIPNGFTTRIKQHWERSYFWQEEDIERQWCLECTTCNELTKSNWGEGCYDYNNNDRRDCQNQDQLWIQNCNGWEGSSGNAEFEIVRGPVADQIKIRNKNFCLERVDNLYINLQLCDPNNVRQLWVGFDMDNPFDLRPLEQNYRANDYGGPVEVHRCMSQQHHPKKYEVLFLEECDLAHFWDTALWDAI
jgi:hypothetical protein